MKKLLLSLVALVAMGTGAFAQNYVWTEDFGTYEAGDVPAGGAYNYVCVDGGSTTKIYAENLAGGTSPELLIAKKDGSFAATVAMDGKSGDFTLTFQSNKGVTVTLSEGATLGELVKSGNNYSYPVAVAAGTANVTFTFTNSSSSNSRFDDVKFFQGVGKKAAGLSWGTASRDVTLGSAENVFPTLTNANNLTVTYSSDNAEVATVAADGTITLVAEGKANISAAFAGNDEYEAQTVTYALTVKAASSSTADIANTAETAYTVGEAVKLIEAGEGLSATVYVKGVISKVDSYNEKYGSITYWISEDGTTTAQQFECYSGLNVGGEKFASVDDLKVGTSVVVKGVMKKYTPKEGDPIYEFNYNNEIVSGAASAVSSIAADKAKVAKVIENGRLVIRSNGKKFNAAGVEVK